MTVLVPETVAKEAIHGFRFEPQEVLSQHEQEQRSRDLFKAMVMGNTYRHKVTITFQTQDGLKQVVTTVWGLTNRWVLLKNGIQIPIKQIVRVTV